MKLRSASASRLWSRLRNNPLTLTCCGLLLALVVTSLLAPLLPLADPNHTQLDNRLAPPKLGAHWLGTDQLGRDIFSRLIFGFRLSLGVAVAGVAVASTLGCSIGLVAGYYGGFVDSVLMRAIDVVMAFPYLLLALAIVAVLGPGLEHATLAVAVVNVPFFARAIRGQVLSLRGEAFIDAARVGGLSDRTILIAEILPLLWPTVIVAVTTSLGWMILETAGLSFLGLGAIPPTADLGGMLGQGRHLLTTAPHVSLLPGGLIFVVVACFNIIGDGLRDALDPSHQTVGWNDATGTFVDAVGQSEPHLRHAHDADNEQQGKRGALLEVNNLTVRFGVSTAVRNVSFQIHTGERVALVGESGSGKSVTALAALRLLEPAAEVSSASIIVAGKDMYAQSESQLARLRGGRMAWVPQDPMSSLHPLRRIGKQLTEVLSLHQNMHGEEAKRAAVKLLEDVDIVDPVSRFDAWPHQLSGGMRQRVVIAMALAGEPELLIADEPTTALDVTTQANVLSLISSLCEKRGTALLFISHDLAVVSQVCDRVLVMHQGRVIEEGSVDDIIGHPEQEYTRKLIGAIPVLGNPERILSNSEGHAGAPSRGSTVEDGGPG